MLHFEAFPVRTSSQFVQSMLSVMAPGRVRRMGSMPSSVTEVDLWHGGIEVVIAAPVEKVWAIASDFLRFPRRCSVECSEGQSGVPGCVRKVIAPNSSFWVAEKLTLIDHSSRIFSYALVDGNSGIEPGYKSAFQAIPEGDCRTRVLWPFMFSPAQVSVESFNAMVTKKVQAHIEELEQLAQAS